MIFLLNIDSIDAIYDYLAEHGIERGALAISCRSFNQLSRVNERYIGVAKKISETYEAISNIEDLPLWRQLKKTAVIIVGENHLVDAHRRACGEVAAMIWDENWVLLTEGGKKHPGKIGQVKYLTDEMLQTEESWDPAEISAIGNEIEGMRHNLLSLVSLFLTARDEGNENTRIGMCERMIATLKALIKIDDKASQTLDLTMEAMKKNRPKGKKRSAMYRTAVAQVFSAIGCLIETRLGTYYVNAINQRILQLNSYRHRHMTWKMTAKVGEGKKAFTIAGKQHALAGPEQPVDLLDEKEIPFVSLIPRPQPAAPYISSEKLESEERKRRRKRRDFRKGIF